MGLSAKGNLCHEKIELWLRRRGGGAAAGGALPRGLRPAGDRRGLRARDARGAGRLPARPAPGGGRRAGAGDGGSAAPLAARLCGIHRPPGRHALRRGAAPRHRPARAGDGQPRHGPDGAARGRAPCRAAALFRGANERQLRLRAGDGLRARAGRALSVFEGAQLRPQRDGPPAVGAGAGGGAADSGLRRRAPRQRVDNGPAVAALCRGALRGRRPRRQRARHPRGGDTLERAVVPGARRGPGRHGPRHRRAYGRGALRRGEARGGGFPGHRLPRRLEGEHRRHGPQPAIPRRLGAGQGDQIRRRLRPPRAARLCGHSPSPRPRAPRSVR